MAYWNTYSDIRPTIDPVYHYNVRSLINSLLRTVAYINSRDMVTSRHQGSGEESFAIPIPCTLKILTVATVLKLAPSTLQTGPRPEPQFWVSVVFYYRILITSNNFIGTYDPYRHYQLFRNWAGQSYHCELCFGVAPPTPRPRMICYT